MTKLQNNQTGMYDYNGLDFVEFNKTPVILTDIPYVKTLHLVKNEHRLVCSKRHFSQFLSIEPRKFYETKKCKRCFGK